MSLLSKFIVDLCIFKCHQNRTVPPYSDEAGIIPSCERKIHKIYHSVDE